MTITAPVPTQATTPARRVAPWLVVCGALFAVAWGGNEFTPLLVMYRQDAQMTPLVLDVLLGAYVLGIVPALILGGPLSDRLGRRPLFLPAPLIAVGGSALLALGADSPTLLFAGRVLSGIALGLVMAVGTAWVKELSQPPFDLRAGEGSGAGRAALALTIGFGLGAGVAAALAQFGPMPQQLPYLLHITLALLSCVLLWRVPESRAAVGARAGSQAGSGAESGVRPQAGSRAGSGAEDRRPLLEDLKIPSAKHLRFLLVVVPMAPWVFGTAASAYAILPGLMMSKAPGLEVAMSGMLCVVALGCGVAAQRLAGRFDDPHSARGVGVALLATVVGMVLAAVAVALDSLPAAIVAAAGLGAAYGLLLVGGLREIQRIAGPDDLAGLTAVYYSLTYVGFFVPAVLALVGAWVPYTALFAIGAVLALVSFGVVALSWRKHLPEE